MRRKANARRRKFEDQLGDTLGAVASSLRAGQSFQQAMSTIALDGPEPMAKEFQRVETETRLGRPADEALQSMAERLASKNFEFVVLAVNIQRQVGGSLSEILDMVSDTVRGRVQFARKVRALTAMGRASAYVLVGMPFFLAAMIFLDRPLVHPSAVGPDSAGHIMVLIGLDLDDDSAPSSAARSSTSSTEALMLLAFAIVLFTVAVYMGLDAVTVRQKQIAGSLARARRYGGAVGARDRADARRHEPPASPRRCAASPASPRRCR